MNVDAARHEGQAENTEPSRTTTESREPSVGLEMLLRVPDLNRVELSDTVQRDSASTSQSKSAAPGTTVGAAQAEAPQPALSKGSGPPQRQTSLLEPAVETGDVPESVVSTVPSDRWSTWKSHWNAMGTAATALPGKVQALASKVKLPAMLGPTASSGGPQAEQVATPRRATIWNSRWKMLGALAAAILLCTFVARAMRREPPVESAPRQLAQQAAEVTTRQSPADNTQASSTSGVPAPATDQGRPVDSANAVPVSPSVDVARRGPSTLTGARRIDFESQTSSPTHVPTNPLQAPSQAAYDPGPMQARSQGNFASRNMEAGSFPADRTSPSGSAYAEATGQAPPGSPVSGGFQRDVPPQYQSSTPSSAPQNYGGNAGPLGPRAYPTGRTAAGEFVGREPSRQVSQDPPQWSRDGATFGGRPDIQLNRPGTLPKPPGPALDGGSPVGAQQFPSGRVHVDAGAQGQSFYPATNPATYMYRSGDFQQIRTSLLTGSGQAPSAGFQSNQPRNADDRSFYPGNPPVTPQRATVPSSSGVYR